MRISSVEVTTGVPLALTAQAAAEINTLKRTAARPGRVRAASGTSPRGTRQGPLERQVQAAKRLGGARTGLRRRRKIAPVAYRPDNAVDLSHEVNL